MRHVRQPGGLTLLNPKRSSWMYTIPAANDGAYIWSLFRGEPLSGQVDDWVVEAIRSQTEEWAGDPFEIAKDSMFDRINWGFSVE